MNERPSAVSQAALLRQAFDRSFALPPREVSQDAEDLLLLRVGGERYALRLREVAGLVTGRKVVPIPADTPDLIGLAGVRGGVVPVFSFSALLGHGLAAGPPRWLILCGAEAPLALAFTDFEGHLRLPTSDIHGDESSGATRRYVSQVASTEAGARAIVGIPLVVAAIRDRSGRDRPTKER